MLVLPQKVWHADSVLLHPRSIISWAPFWLRTLNFIKITKNKIKLKKTTLTTLQFMYCTILIYSPWCTFRESFFLILPYRYFQKQGENPQIMNFNRVFHYKPSSLVVFPLFLETPICDFLQLLSWSWRVFAPHSWWPSGSSGHPPANRIRVQRASK